MKLLRRFLREPLPALAVVMLGAILTVVLCHLDESQQAEMESFQNTYASVPVHFEITDLDGGQVSVHNGIQGWVVDLFYSEGPLEPSFAHMTKDHQLRLEYECIVGDLPDDPKAPATRKRVIGITSTRVARELTPEYGGEITWNDGFDESILGTDSLVIIVPADLEIEPEVQLTFTYKDEQKREYAYSQTFTVVGRFIDQGNQSFYCPYQVMDIIYREIKASRVIQCFAATLTDNQLLEELHETASHWFAQPNPLGEPTYWGKYGYTNYPYALDIRDELLVTLKENLETSLTVNRLASIAVLLLSCATGLLTGFLMVRSRKREIGLMRTLGCSNIAVYREYTVEQLICITAGTLSGNALYQWKAMDKAAMLIGLYVLGLSIALMVFMRSNLLMQLKEDE